MSHVSTIGMLLFLILAIVGGFLTGIFSRYVYRVARAEFGKLVAILCSVVFYIAPVWALISIFNWDDLVVFYLLLLLGFAYGTYFFAKIADNSTIEPPLFPPD